MNNKKVHLEFIRAISILLVMFAHTGDDGYLHFAYATDSTMYPLYLLMAIACRFSVPLFWMVSGALLLPKEESYGRVFRHRILRVAIVIVVFAGVNYAWQILTGRASEISLDHFLRALYTCNFVTAYAYWFLYAYIGILLMLPILQKLVKVMSRQDFHYLFLFIIILRCLLPIAEYFTGQGTISLSSWISESLLGNNVMYFMAGYYFEHVRKEEELNVREAIIWILLGLSAMIVTALVSQYRMNLTGNLLSDHIFFDNLACIPAFAVYYTVRYLFLRHRPSPTISCVICTFGGCAFGIMLIEGILREELRFIYNALCPILHSNVPAAIVWVLACYLCGTVIVLCLKKIPGIRRLI